MSLDRQVRHATAAIAAALWLSACGGGGSPAAADADPGPAAADVLSYGTITALGSVWVNGVRYDTSDAAVRIDDGPASTSDLRVGMVVRVDGRAGDDGSASASTVTVDDGLKGRVEQVLDANRIVVMGQTVLVDDRTRFDSGARPGVGDYVEVHGQLAGEASFAASYVERKATLADPPFAVTGRIASHDPASRSFTVGALAVSYGAGTVLGDMPGAPWVGLTVEVKGTVCAGSPVCGTLAASKVEPAGLGSVDSARTEFEGFVTRLTADGFMLGAQAVVIGPGTRFEGGVAGDIAVGSKLEVEGSLAGGVLTARKVSLRENVRLEGDVAELDLAAGRLRLAGLPTLTVGVNALTQFDHLASLAALGASNHVRVKGRSAGGGTVVAVEIELRSTSPDGRVVLQGPVSAIGGTSTLTILGTVVDTRGVSDSDFKSHDDAAIGRSAFFAAVGTGTVVKARGRLAGGASVAWDEMELED